MAELGRSEKFNKLHSMESNGVLRDVLHGVERERRILDHGFVNLVDVMPRLVYVDQTADAAIIEAARVSYGKGTKKVTEDRGLVRYLARHTHTTPTEMVEWKFHCRMPIFIARQWIRHRTANVNEMSGRYSILPNEFYHPGDDNVRQQSKTNKQGGDDKVDQGTAEDFCHYLEVACIDAYAKYEAAIEKGISREQARMILPLNLYTEWYWKIDLHNLFHFLGLRCDSHAQYEIRVFAQAMLDMISPIVPFAVEAFNDYHHHRGAMKLSRLELEAVKKMLQVGRGMGGFDGVEIETENKREQEEWIAKMKRLGIESHFGAA